MTDGPSATPSWNKAPIWGLRPDFYYCLLALARAVILGSESLGTRDHILLSQIRDFPFRRLLRLAGSRWMYSIPPTHGSVLCMTSMAHSWL
jgi:hypothetical protein